MGITKNTKPIQTAAFDVPEYEIAWKGAYRPRISPDHLRQLWSRKLQVGKPITQLVAEALDPYFSTLERG